MEAPVHRTLAVAKEPEGWARGVAAVPEDGGRGGGGGEGGREDLARILPEEWTLHE